MKLKWGEVTKELVDKIKKIYIEDNKSKKDLCDIFNMNNNQISYILRKNKINKKVDYDDCVNKKYNHLTIIKILKDRRNNRKIAEVQCDCESRTIKQIPVEWVVNGKVKSCGCICTSEYFSKLKTKHGLRYTRFYTIYMDMFQRCENKNNKAYNYYGGRGIQVCNEWTNFEVFIEDMYNSYLQHCDEFGVKNTTIDRVDVNRGYSVDNCRWATFIEQGNNRRDNVYYNVYEKYDTLSNLCRLYNKKFTTVRDRLNKLNWNIYEALELVYREKITHKSLSKDI